MCFRLTELSLFEGVTLMENVKSHHYLGPHLPEVGSLVVEVDEEEDDGGVHEEGGDGEMQHLDSAK